MNRSRVLVLGGLLTAALIVPAIPAQADRKEHFEHHENPGKHLGWDKSTGKKFDEHDRRHYRHSEPRYKGRDVRYEPSHNDRRSYRHPEPRYSHRDVRHDYKARHDKSEFRRNVHFVKK